VSHEYHVIGDEDTVLGFRCAGVPGTVVTTAEAARTALRTLRKSAAGVVLITETAADLAREEVDDIRFNAELPMVVQIPGPQGPIPGRRDLAAIIREAIGIKV
jgi:vacuolar-type H+-ATPase subunit F/Vma7